MGDNNDYEQMARAQLVALSKQRGLNAAGKSVEMVARLREFDQQQVPKAVPPMVIKAPKPKKGSSVQAPAWLDEEEDLEDDDEEVEIVRGGGQGTGRLSESRIRQIVAQEARAGFQEMFLDLSGAVSQATVSQKELRVRQEALIFWRDASFSSTRSDAEYEALKLAGRELFVLYKTVDDPVLQGKLTAIHAILEDRAMMVFTGERAGWSAADATFLPAGSLFAKNKDRFEKAMDESRKRRREESYLGGGGGSGNAEVSFGSGFNSPRQGQVRAQAAAVSNPQGQGVRRTGPVTCYNCGAQGHVRRDCPQPPKSFAPATANQSTDQPFRTGGAAGNN